MPVITANTNVAGIDFTSDGTPGGANGTLTINGGTFNAVPRASEPRTSPTFMLEGGSLSGTTSVVNASLDSGTVAKPGTVTLTGASTVAAINISGHLVNGSTGTLTHSGDGGYLYLQNGTGFFENAGHYIDTNGSYGVYWDGTAGSRWSTTRRNVDRQREPDRPQRHDQLRLPALPEQRHRRRAVRHS